MFAMGDHAATERALEIIKAALTGGAITLPGLNKTGVAADAGKFDSDYLAALLSGLKRDIQKSAGE